jgi:hypothetical protein
MEGIMPDWKGIIGLGLEPTQFRRYVATLHFTAWRPQFVVLHNTAVPTLADWHRVSGEQRMKNLEHFYRDVQGWSAGPHLFVADDLVWVFTALVTSGVHSPSWNGLSWGVEMVGNFDAEDFQAGGGAAVRDNVVSALATLHMLAGLDPETMRLHREDPNTTHRNYPGGKVLKSDVIGRVLEEVNKSQGGEHPLNEDEAASR